MFKIIKLTMYDMQDQSYTYEFSEGTNYFQGKNSSGKTEFYSFIDFMFGSSEDIIKKPWYINSLVKATMLFDYNGDSFYITRTRNRNQNYLYYADENENDIEPIDLREYKDKLNSIFAQDIPFLKDIRNFTNEELTYRAFTMFNFLGEEGQGRIHDFLDKCRFIKYSVKLNPILNFIFNKNIERIYELKKELDNLIQEVKELESNTQKYNFIINQVNKNLQKVGGKVWYTGENADTIKKYISDISNMQNVEMSNRERNIADLEVMYNNLSEQIKVYENNINDARQFESDNENRKKLLSKLHELILEDASLDYLVTPIQELLSEIDNTIFFSNYVINDNTVKELKKQRDRIKTELRRNDSRFTCYTLEEKTKAIALVEEYLSVEIDFADDNLKEKKKKIRELREELNALQNSDDTKKIKELSKAITNLYMSVKDISSVVSDDMECEGFEIRYIKKGNILQPMIASDDVENKDSDKHVNYYIGSMARHTLIQLCGYFAFLDILLESDQYPIIPMFVIDHISKPFDEKNSKAIGKIIAMAYDMIGKENLQMFIFDDEDPDKLGISPDHFENLVSENKTGFNPFYIQ